MSKDSKSNYGAFEQLDELEDTLRELGNLLEIPAENLSYRLNRLLPMVFSIRENLKAIFSLRKAQLAQESFLIGNIALGRAVNFCYLLAIERDSFDELTNPAGLKQNIEQGAEAFLSLNLTSLKDQDYGYRSPDNQEDAISFAEKIDTIIRHTDLKAEGFQIAKASLSPISTEMISGSYYGCLSRFAFVNFSKYKTPIEAYNRFLRGEFTILYFVLCLVLSQVIKAIAQENDTEDLSSKSQAIVNKAAGLVSRMKSSNDGSGNFSAVGLWESLLPVEATAASILTEKFRVHENAIRKCYELGVQAPSIPSNRHYEADMQLAGLFLKRTLNDLRTVWMLTSAGYTSQAASVAASLFEHALTVVYIAGDSKRAEKLEAFKTGDLPWNVRTLSENLAKSYAESNSDKVVSDDDLYDMTGMIYGVYKYLCKIKHPTLRSTGHDSGSSSIEPGKYAIMALPDLREENDSLKSFIINISLIRCFDAIKHFVNALEPDETKQAFIEFSEKLKDASKESDQAFEALLTGPALPFGIGDEAIKWERNRPSRKKGKKRKR
ncbi:MAG: hypothetical protein H6656_17955 [Ardenticatenaceae bacterium]|nr:hypothetical protein [Ardenticatenaceae bacterium]